MFLKNYINFKIFMKVLSIKFPINILYILEITPYESEPLNTKLKNI